MLNPSSLTRKSQKRAVGWLATIVLLGGALGCSPKPETPQTIRPVQVLVVGQAAEGGKDTHSGEIRSRTEISLAFRVNGKVLERLVNLGDKVQAGQVLARLESTDSQLSLDAAAAQATLAENDFRRYQELRSKNFVSQAALDAKETAYKAARAQSDLAAHQRDYTVLKADHAGVVAAVLVETGQVVSAGQPAFRVARDDQLEVAIQVSEQQVAHLKKGMPAQVSLWADASIQLSGKIREIAGVAELPARTFAVRVSLPAFPSPTSTLLRLGQSANVQFEGPRSLQTSAGTLLPATAIFQQGQQAAVWVVTSTTELGKEGLATVHLQPVKISAWQESGALVTEGIKAGDRLVKAGVHKLTDGETVKAIQP